MAWTTPRTWTTGEVVVASYMNSDVRDNPLYLYDSAPQLIATATPNAAIVSFTSIPQTFTHLQVLVTGRGNGAVTSADVLLRINGDTGSNYDRQYLVGSGATDAAGITAASTSALCGQLTSSTGTASKGGAVELTFPDYRGTTFHKTVIARGGHYDSGVHTEASLNTLGWRSTAAITQIDLHSGAVGTGWVSGTKATLHGVH